MATLIGTAPNQVPVNGMLGTAAFTDASNYASAAQGAKADTALQPADKQTAISDFTPGRLAVVDYIPRPTIDQIAGLAPTLDLDFERQIYRHYTPALGLREKPLSDIVTFTRASNATYFDAKGVLQTAGSNVPRLDFDPVTGACRGLLIEEARTNLLTYSEQFDNAAWEKVNAAISENAIVAPDGTLTGDTLIASSGSTFSIFNSSTIALAKNGTYSASVFVKSAGAGFAYIQLNAFSNNICRCFINLATGATALANSGNGSAITGSNRADNLRNGWWRLSFAGIPNTNDSATGIQFGCGPASSLSSASYTGDGTSGIYIWGAQLEQGAFPTSYIPTTTAAATRAADVAKIDGTAFSDFYRQEVGCFLVEITAGQNTGTRSVLDINNASTSEQISLYRRASDGTRRLSVTDGGVSQAFLNSGNFIGSEVVAIAYKENDFYVAVRGAGYSDTSGTVPTPTVLYLGNDLLGTSFICGGVLRLAYWPTRIPNATLQQLTA